MFKGIKKVYKRRGLLGTAAVIVVGPIMALMYGVGITLTYIGNSITDMVHSI